MALRFLGGALGVPFMPIKSMLGTDLIRKYRFRKNFTGEKVCLIPSVRLDFSTVYVQRVDVEGNAQIDEYGNINTTYIGDFENPVVRLPGSGRGNDIVSSAKRIVVIMTHQKEIR